MYQLDPPQASNMSDVIEVRPFTVLGTVCLGVKHLYPLGVLGHRSLLFARPLPTVKRCKWLFEKKKSVF